MVSRATASTHALASIGAFDLQLFDKQIVSTIIISGARARLSKLIRTLGFLLPSVLLCQLKLKTCQVLKVANQQKT